MNSAQNSVFSRVQIYLSCNTQDITADFLQLVEPQYQIVLIHSRWDI